MEEMKTKDNTEIVLKDYRKNIEDWRNFLYGEDSDLLLCKQVLKYNQLISEVELQEINFVIFFENWSKFIEKRKILLESLDEFELCNSYHIIQNRLLGLTNELSVIYINKNIRALLNDSRQTIRNEITFKDYING